MMNGDGSGIRQLTDGPGNNYGVGWSYTGDAIYFSTDRDGQFDIYTIDVFGGGDAPLIEHPADDHWAR
jgi:Tol biopolymer transport system component